MLHNLTICYQIIYAYVYCQSKLDSHGPPTRTLFLQKGVCSEQVHCLDETVNLLNEMMTAVPCAAIVQLSGYGFQQLSPVKLKHPVPKENKELLWGEAPIIEQSGASA